MDNGCDDDDPAKKKLNDDFVLFIRKRSETEAPKYTAKLQNYVNLHKKRQRAARARHHGVRDHRCKRSADTRKNKEEHPDGNKNADNPDNQETDGGLNSAMRSPSRSSRCSSDGQQDACCCKKKRRRRSRPRRKRRRSCCRKRRRRSCSRRRRRRGRKSCARKRRRSCSRRRRRRSCARKRRRRSCGRRRR